jgi:uncharacterized protein
MMRVVLDSNVWISALIFGGVPRRIVELAEEGLIKPYISKPLGTEVERVLEIKFHWPLKRVLAATGYLWSLASHVDPQCVLQACSDPDDNRVLECAVAAKAECLVTGDQHR